MTEKLITAQQLADELGVSLRTIYWWNQTGTAPKRIRVGVHVRYRRRDVDAWLEKRVAA